MSQDLVLFWPGYGSVNLFFQKAFICESFCLTAAIILVTSESYETPRRKVLCENNIQLLELSGEFRSNTFLQIAIK